MTAGFTAQITTRYFIRVRRTFPSRGVYRPGFYGSTKDPMTFPKTLPTLLALLALTAPALAPTASAQTPAVYANPNAPLEARVSDLFARLTPDEKITLLDGTGFTTRPIPRLGIPPMAMADAGQGVRGGLDSTLGPATLFPAGVTMASTWNPALISQVGQAIGEEARNKGTGVQVMLGPAVNIHRSPLGGRNGEYFSEDPYLAGQMAVGYIQGMQSTGVASCIKHFALNNQETDRFTVNVQIGERALREIYLPAFEAGVTEGHAWTLMSSYNKINGLHASANPYTLTDVLKRGWGWDGMVMSDWGGVHATAATVQAGNDLEMPGPAWLAPKNVERDLKRGQITQATIDENVHRILRAIFRVGLLNGPLPSPDHAQVGSAAHQEVAYTAATEGIVLLKNSANLLPLNAAKLRSVAVIGPAAKEMQYGAEGSPGVTPTVSVSPLDGLTRRLGPFVTVNYARGLASGAPVPASALLPPTGAGTGLRAEYFSNRNLQGAPVLTRTDAQIQDDWSKTSPDPSVPRTEFSVRWTGRLLAPKTGTYALTLTADDGCRLFLDGKPLVDRWLEGGATAQTASVALTAGQTYDLRVEYFQGGGDAVARLDWTLPGTSSYADAVEAARNSDVAIVLVSTKGTESEGQDRPSMNLPGDQDALIEAVAATNPRTIVVLNNGTPVTMTAWLNRVPALVEAWLPGEMGGRALAAVLFGDVNPSGKLPDTLGARREDYPDFGHYPGVKRQVDYAEGIYVGYRGFDKHKITPMFPFGYGLSYTTFSYGKPRLSSGALTPTGTVTVRVPVTNTGKREGAEVVELYVHDPKPKIDKPVRELKGFGKVRLRPGETKTVMLTLTGRDLAYFDVPSKQWKADAGTYELQIGASSRDIRRQLALRLTSNYTKAVPLSEDQAQQRKTHAATETDLALNELVTASSVQTTGELDAKFAVDGDDDTRWASQFSDPQWIAVDLGKPTEISHVRLSWEVACASVYSVQVSPDGTTWTDVYHTDDGASGVEDIHFKPTTTRHVRVYGTKRATTFGYSLYSVEVYR